MCSLEVKFNSLDKIRHRVADLLEMDDTTLRFEPVTGGLNNKIFRLDLDDSSFLIKIYFQHPDDSRDRLKAEFSFYRFAWENGIMSLPEPIAYDYKYNFAIYEFIEGKQLNSDEINEEYVLCALNFYHELNKYKDQAENYMLPVASEACFSIRGHLACVQRRIDMLKNNIDDSLSINRDAAHFVKKELLPVWDEILNNVYEKNNKFNLIMDSEILAHDMRLSPSDFGFHNAILSKDNTLRFIDFEYAGWDDPVKMVCDFFCQPKVGVPLNYFDKFSEIVVSDLSKPKLFRQRIKILFPVYQIKWCCIILNDFLPIGSQRRNFANCNVDPQEHKIRQLHKAYKSLRNLNF